MTKSVTCPDELGTLASQVTVDYSQLAVQGRLAAHTAEPEEVTNHHTHNTILPYQCDRCFFFLSTAWRNTASCKHVKSSAWTTSIQETHHLHTLICKLLSSTCLVWLFAYNIITQHISIMLLCSVLSRLVSRLRIECRSLVMAVFSWSRRPEHCTSLLLTASPNESSSTVPAQLRRRYDIISLKDLEARIFLFSLKCTYLCQLCLIDPH